MAALGAAALVVGPLAPAYAFPAVSSQGGEPVGVAAEVPMGEPTADPTAEPTPDPAPTPEPAPAPKPSWKMDSVGWWYDLDNGSYARDEKRDIDGATYRFNGSGYMVTGWYYLGGAWE